MLCARSVRSRALRGVGRIPRRGVAAGAAAPEVASPPKAVAAPEAASTQKAVATMSALAPASTDVLEETAREQGEVALGATTNRYSADAVKPGVRDDANFRQHWSVAAWRAYAWPPPGAKLTTADGLQTVLREISARASAANVLQDTTSAAYWAYHVARLSFFALQGTGAVAAQALRSGSAQSGRVQWIFGEVSLETMLNGIGLMLPAEAIGAWSQDLKLVQRGAFKLPWDMTTFGHQQNNPLWVAGQARRFLREAVDIYKRRAEPHVARGELPYGDSPLYPPYYQNNFHFQTDGWFSSDSAKVYEGSTETLFLGRQDAMQRSTLVPIAQRFPGSKGDGLSVLEIAAGTGRFATFVRDNYPNAHFTVTDLSPFYLEEARKNMAYWERMRGGGGGGGSCEFRQCAAERLPFADASQDVVYSVYMFHEMPTPARNAAIAEMARVLKPGGLLVITDSTQLGDRPAQDDKMENFTNLNEPHYPTYIRFDFGDAFKAAGLVPGMKVMQSVSKALSAVKVDAAMN